MKLEFCVFDNFLPPSPPCACVVDSVLNAMLLSHILDLLLLCVEKHFYLVRSYIIEKNILGRVLVLMTSCHTHLALGILYIRTVAFFCAHNSSLEGAMELKLAPFFNDQA